MKKITSIIFVLAHLTCVSAFADFEIYAKHEHVNTFEEVQGSVSKYPRYDVKYRAGGLHWQVDSASFFKAEYGEESTGLESLPKTNTLKLNFGFEFKS